MSDIASYIAAVESDKIAAHAIPAKTAESACIGLNNLHHIH